ncbi:MAG: hypothetical protein K0R31_1923 [Clostridiales bacterium]|nr:hypothetical protein [Clostridiales bacterium]
MAEVEVIESLMDAEDIKNIEGAFLSGTSIKVLPISKIGNLEYASGSHPVIVKIRDEYDKLIAGYIGNSKGIIGMI